MCLLVNLSTFLHWAWPGVQAAGLDRWPPLSLKWRTAWGRLPSNRRAPQPQAGQSPEWHRRRAAAWETGSWHVIMPGNDHMPCNDHIAKHCSNASALNQPHPLGRYTWPLCQWETTTSGYLEWGAAIERLFRWDLWPIQEGGRHRPDSILGTTADQRQRNK